jgi:hypothetical protein
LAVGLASERERKQKHKATKGNNPRKKKLGPELNLASPAGTEWDTVGMNLSFGFLGSIDVTPNASLSRARSPSAFFLPFLLQNCQCAPVMWRKMKITGVLTERLTLKVMSQVVVLFAICLHAAFSQGLI